MLNLPHDHPIHPWPGRTQRMLHRQWRSEAHNPLQGRRRRLGNNATDASRGWCQLDHPINHNVVWQAEQMNPDQGEQSELTSHKTRSLDGELRTFKPSTVQTPALGSPKLRMRAGPVHDVAFTAFTDVHGPLSTPEAAGSAPEGEGGGPASEAGA